MSTKSEFALNPVVEPALILPVLIVVDSGAAATLKTNADNNSTTYSGTFGSGVSLDKRGTGTLTLSGNNNYTGSTTANVGTLAAGSTTGFSVNSDFTVSNNGTLDLAGFSNSIGSLAGTGTVPIAVRLPRSRPMAMATPRRSPASFRAALISSKWAPIH